MAIERTVWWIPGGTLVTSDDPDWPALEKFFRAHDINPMGVPVSTSNEIKVVQASPGGELMLDLWQAVTGDIRTAPLCPHCPYCVQQEHARMPLRVVPPRLSVSRLGLGLHGDEWPFQTIDDGRVVLAPRAAQNSGTDVPEYP